MVRQSDFIIYFNIFGEFDWVLVSLNFEDWDAAQLINRCGRVALAPLLGDLDLWAGLRDGGSNRF